MLRFNSLDEFADYLGRVRRNAPMTVARALKDEAELTLGATIPFTPIEYGPLRASGRTSNPALGPGGLTIDITFGGAAAGYAVYVHERVINRATGKRIFHQSPTKAKFLSETAEGRMNETHAGMFARTVALFVKGR